MVTAAAFEPSPGNGPHDQALFAEPGKKPGRDQRWCAGPVSGRGYGRLIRRLSKVRRICRMRTAAQATASSHHAIPPRPPVQTARAARAATAAPSAAQVTASRRGRRVLTGPPRPRPANDVPAWTAPACSSTSPVPLGWACAQTLARRPLVVCPRHRRPTGCGWRRRSSWSGQPWLRSAPDRRAGLLPVWEIPALAKRLSQVGLLSSIASGPLSPATSARAVARTSPAVMPCRRPMSSSGFRACPGRGCRCTGCARRACPASAA